MNKFNIGMVIFTAALPLGAAEQTMFSNDYKLAKEKIASQYIADQVACEPLLDNRRDVCLAEANGKQAVASAELEYQYKPGPKTLYDAQVTKANADYAVDMERCDDEGPEAKDACVSEAKATQASALAAAKAGLKSTDADAEAVTQEKAPEAHKPSKKTARKKAAP